MSISTARLGRVSGARVEYQLEDLEGADLAKIIRILFNCQPKSPVETRALEKLDTFIVDFESGEAVFHRVKSRPQFGEFVLERMFAYADTQDKLRRLMDLSPNFSPTLEKIVDFLTTSARTLKNWCQLLLLCARLHPNSAVQEKIENGIMSQANTFADWEQVCAVAKRQGCRRLLVHALKEQKQAANSLADLVKVFDQVTEADDDEAEKAVLDKVATVDAPLEEWMDVVRDSDQDERLQKVAVSRALTLCSTSMHAVEILEKALEIDVDFARDILPEALRKISDLGHLARVYIQEFNSQNQELILAAVKGITPTIQECLDYLENGDPQHGENRGELDEAVFEIVLSAIASQAESLKLYKVVAQSGYLSDDGYQKRVLEKFKQFGGVNDELLQEISSGRWNAEDHPELITLVFTSLIEVAGSFTAKVRVYLKYCDIRGTHWTDDVAMGLRAAVVKSATQGELQLLAIFSGRNSSSWEEALFDECLRSLEG